MQARCHLSTPASFFTLAYFSGGPAPLDNRSAPRGSAFKILKGIHVRPFVRMPIGPAGEYSYSWFNFQAQGNMVVSLCCMPFPVAGMVQMTDIHIRCGPKVSNRKSIPGDRKEIPAQHTFYIYYIQFHHFPFFISLSLFFCFLGHGFQICPIHYLFGLVYNLSPALWFLSSFKSITYIL